MEYGIKTISKREKEQILSKIRLNDLYQSKAEIYGCCIKLFTDNFEFKNMWIENFRSMLDNIRPHARIFCMGNKKKPEVLYEPFTKTLIIKNCNYYGFLKSAALGLINEYLEDVPSEHRRYSIHGSCVDLKGRALGIIGPSGSGKTTLTYGLLLDARFNFLTDDWFFVRITENGIKAFSSEKNSYLRDGLEKVWPEFKDRIKNAKKDRHGRFLANVVHIFSDDRIVEESNLGAIVLLTRKKGAEILKKLDLKSAVRFMVKNNFCNPHLLTKDKEKKKLRVKFFNELFAKIPVYMLNTIETPEESLNRIIRITKEI